MAKPIRNTPTLRGKYAQDFLQNIFDSIEELDNPSMKKAKVIERERMAKNYELLMKISVNSL